MAGGRITVPKPPLAASLLALPESEQAVPRPLMKRLVRRHSGLPVGSPTDVERHDAIELLAVTDDPDDPLQQEAEDVLWRSRRDDR